MMKATKIQAASVYFRVYTNLVVEVAWVEVGSMF